MICATTTILLLPFGAIGAAKDSAKGPKLWKESRGKGKLQYGVAEIVIDAPAKNVHRVLEEFDDYHEFIPNCTKSRELENSKKRARVYLEVELLGGIDLWSQIRIEKKQGERVVEYIGKQEKGNFDELRAYYHVRELSDTKTKLRVKFLFNPGLMVPNSVLDHENMVAAREVSSAVASRARD